MNIFYTVISRINDPDNPEEQWEFNSWEELCAWVNEETIHIPKIKECNSEDDVRTKFNEIIDTINLISKKINKMKCI